jgi:hypothetical protein
VQSGILIALLPVLAVLNKIFDDIDNIIFIHEINLRKLDAWNEQGLAKFCWVKLGRKAVLL